MLGYEFVLSIILAAKQKLFQTSLVIFEFHHLQSSNHPLAYPANSFSNVKWMFFSLSQSLPLSLLSFSLQEKRISSLDAANSRLMSALTQVKERYGMQNLRNGLSPTNPTKLSITENGEFKNSSCWLLVRHHEMVWWWSHSLPMHTGQGPVSLLTVCTIHLQGMSRY